MPVESEELRKASLFAPLSEDDMARVAAVTVERRYERGDIIILEGDRGGALYFVRSGLVKVFKSSPGGKEQVLRLIEAGRTFNDVPALDAGPNPASAAALEPSIVYATGGAELRRLISERPGVALATVQALAGALRHLVALVEDLSFRHVTARVAKILIEQDASVGASGASGKATHRLTQQEMAAMAGTAREMVGRALKELEATGAIRIQRGRITVVSRERLAMF
ncbi:MAG TPA: Crp/Fnr family transcriptional regulator, partial [Ktedonobacterales bacterium]|nr:Crp/Fnr family transcriptional regulator [Ktedonobacterales bacterium]